MGFVTGESAKYFLCIWSGLPASSCVQFAQPAGCFHKRLQLHLQSPCRMWKGVDEFARELEQEKKIRSQAKTPRWVLSPNSPKRICWDLLGVIVLLYDLIMIPLYTAFPLQDNIFLSMMTGITLAFWSLDILACFCVGYYAKDGTLVVSLARIAKQHLGRMLMA